MSQKTVTLYNQTPKITDQDNIYHLSSICPIYQAPDNVIVTSAEELIRVGKKYQEVCVYTKKRRFTGYDHTFYRCLFSDPSSANKAHEEISKKWEKQKKIKAAKEYEKSKYKEEMFKAIEGDL